MSKSHKKMKLSDDYENKSHHTFKRLKNNQAKKQLRRLDRELDKTKYRHWQQEEFA